MNGEDVGVLNLTAVFTWEEDTFVASCPELDISTCGDTLDEAKAMLSDALRGFFEVASSKEIERRLSGQRFVLPLRISGASAAAVQCSANRMESPLAVSIG